MVYLSELTLDPRRPGVLTLLGDTYALHQALARAFPNREAGGMGRVLFRVESGCGQARILVQSENGPDWSRLEIPHELRGCREVQFRLQDDSPVVKSGQLLRFRLRANPTVKREGKRRAVTEPVQQTAWLERKGCDHGFELVPIPKGDGWFDPFVAQDERQPCRMEVQAVKLDLMKGRKPGVEARIQHFCVDFNGVLRVTDPEKFVEALERGIGSGKGFGFGLLSVARL